MRGIHASVPGQAPGRAGILTATIFVVDVVLGKPDRVLQIFQCRDIAHAWSIHVRTAELDRQVVRRAEGVPRTVAGRAGHPAGSREARIEEYPAPKRLQLLDRGSVSERARDVAQRRGSIRGVDYRCRPIGRFSRLAVRRTSEPRCNAHGQHPGQRMERPGRVAAREGSRLEDHAQWFPHRPHGTRIAGFSGRWRQSAEGDSRSFRCADQ